MPRPSVHYIHNDMRGAPPLTSIQGDLITVLDASLVTGFGLTTASSVVVSDGVATVTLPSGNGFSLHANVLVAGATPSELNGVSRVTSSEGDIITFDTDAADGTATGAITLKVAPAGWEKVFSATNKAVYRSTDVQGARHYLRVSETGGLNMARVVAYEEMSDVDTGVMAYPTETQKSGGGLWSKSVASNSTPVRYDLFADSRFFMIAIEVGAAFGSSYRGVCLRGFGDPVALSPLGDPFASVLGCGLGETTDLNDMYGGFEAIQGNIRGALYAARPLSGGAGAIVVDSRTYVGSQAYESGADPTLGAFPSPVTGGLMWSGRYLSESGNVPRARIPGILHVPQTGLITSAIQAGDFLEGAGPLAGRVLVALRTRIYLGSGITGVAFVDISGPWR